MCVFKSFWNDRLHAAQYFHSVASYNFSVWLMEVEVGFCVEEKKLKYIQFNRINIGMFRRWLLSSTWKELCSIQMELRH